MCAEIYLRDMPRLVRLFACVLCRPPSHKRWHLHSYTKFFENSWRISETSVNYDHITFLNPALKRFVYGMNVCICSYKLLFVSVLVFLSYSFIIIIIITIVIIPIIIIIIIYIIIMKTTTIIVINIITVIIIILIRIIIDLIDIIYKIIIIIIIIINSSSSWSSSSSSSS